MSETQNAEYVTAVLQITREQLSRSISLNAELEAALNLERQRNELLQAELEKLTATKDKDKDTKEQKWLKLKMERGHSNLTESY